MELKDLAQELGKTFVTRIAIQIVLGLTLVATIKLATKSATVLATSTVTITEVIKVSISIAQVAIAITPLAAEDVDGTKGATLDQLFWVAFLLFSCGATPLH